VPTVVVEVEVGVEPAVREAAAAMAVVATGVTVVQWE